ncbi:enamine deaminase RidA (YjgF/YER057c/UK114 family) [Thermocatellispora tengchongensis]|uniref:Enamine deaminase RidA (YjgF/YER057c/UK114 family) n=1 Tax=Thermocatellispora tengchongensis TaxID=1073253 RepID=A0A840PDC9_9ACTN|nr:RidA family protein [Thermocatellispora tengchongensis]MBB5135420.1 enamine deaminase RidA (YjgF/YER057c/UK114 family) [Thermocatellispora tengchongensis]
MSVVETRLASMGIELPRRIRPGGGLVPVVEHGDLLFVSGHGPEDNEGNLLYRGQVGGEVSLEDAILAARATGIQLLRTLRDHLGDLDRIDRIVKALGFVNSAPGFHDQPRVMHGFSDLMTEIFGARGQHARSAIGTSSLPSGQPVEIELIVAVRP